MFARTVVGLQRILRQILLTQSCEAPPRPSNQPTYPSALMCPEEFLSPHSSSCTVSSGRFFVATSTLRPISSALCCGSSLESTCTSLRIYVVLVKHVQAPQSHSCVVIIGGLGLLRRGALRKDREPEENYQYKNVFHAVDPRPNRN